MTARSLMVLGTSSHVGKSMLTTALCSIFHSAGYSVAPFKAQNLSLNSAATPEGLEIGRAQALQAEAAGIAPSADMNPILVKPAGPGAAQWIIRGRVWKQMPARANESTPSLLAIAEESYRMLAAQYDVVVMEGAGSPAEINLRDSDIANTRMAALVGAPCLLVGDIDRGGVFASLLGTIELLDPAERRLIRGFVINKFRGDLARLMPGVQMMEERLGIPCMGVLPYLPSLSLDEEDSVALEGMPNLPWSEEHDEDRRLKIAVVALPSLSNFTDFDSLKIEPSVALRYVRRPDELTEVDAILLPGSKQTIDDLRWLKQSGFDEAIQRAAAAGKWVVGICGGMQMLGSEVLDPFQMEGTAREVGLGILPIRTTLAREKVTTTVTGVLQAGPFARAGDCAVRGYEIHLGHTEYLPEAAPFAEITRADRAWTALWDGCVCPSGRVFGTYLHGIFDGDEFRHLFVGEVRASLGLAAPRAVASWSTHRRQQLDSLAREFGRALDLPAIFQLLQLERTKS